MKRSSEQQSHGRSSPIPSASWLWTQVPQERGSKGSSPHATSYYACAPARKEPAGLL